MCRPVTCKTCKKTTWAGCGQHVDRVRASVPEGQWCTCERSAREPLKGLFSRLLGGR